MTMAILPYNEPELLGGILAGAAAKDAPNRSARVRSGHFCARCQWGVDPIGRVP
jgi:hypothetical protein